MSSLARWQQNIRQIYWRAWVKIIKTADGNLGISQHLLTDIKSTPTIKTALDNAQQTLAHQINLGLAEARTEVQALLKSTLNNASRAWLITHENEVLEANRYVIFEALLKRRLAGEPLAYILGRREFYGLDLLVTPDTLIPRPDTETLVDAALSKIQEAALDHAVCQVLDLGTGTGAIALAIAHNQPQAAVTAVDFSKAALKVAQQNAENLNLTHVHFMHSDWFSALKGQQFDVIVSNPPYIEAHDPHLAALNYEPIAALTSGIDGLDDLKKIISSALIYLKPQAWIMLEHGYNQATMVRNLLAENGLTDIATLKDLAGNDRVTVAKNPLIINKHWV